MADKDLLDKIIHLTEDIVKLKMENVRLKEELKHEQELKLRKINNNDTRK